MSNPDQSADSVFTKADSAAVMKHARLRPVIEVECKECRSLLGYEVNRGDAWVVFLHHWQVAHIDSSGSEES